MLKQIRKIKGLGVFDNYTATPALKAFDRFNLVYGENGSGKTTLSRLLASLQDGDHKDYPNLEYSIESLSGSLRHGQKYGSKIRVFNSDFVEANIGCFDGPLRHILILGEENKAVAAEIKTEIETRDSRNKKIEDQSIEVGKLETEKGKIFSRIAQTIGEATSGSTLRTYRKPDAEKAFDNIGAANSSTDSELEVHRATVRQEQMPKVGSLCVPDIVLPGTDKTIGLIGAVHDLEERCQVLTTRSAQSAIIADLAANPAISTWVEEGVHLHNAHGSTTCKFCDQPMPISRLVALAGHFSVEDQKLKGEIEDERLWIATIRESIGRFVLPDRLALYSELRHDYDIAASLLGKTLIALNERMAAIDGALADKLARRTESYALNIGADAVTLEASLQTIDGIILRHDEKTASFDTAKTAARNAIEAHYLLTVTEHVGDAVRKINALNAATDLLKNGGDGLPDMRSLGDITQSVTDKQAQISSEHKGGEELTSHLKQFLGRTDLIFESGDGGYVVKRNGKPAKRLSEGEKTAIAFLYFLVQLKDQDFVVAEGIVVIDDPISSLDAAAIYQAFSFLKNATKDAKQLFILTHNHEFLRLVLNWFKNLPGALKKKCSYTMVFCAETAGGRSAKMAPLDQLLIDHATEYHYLFKVLHGFQSDGTILSCYHIPNIARKVLETFLDFHLPSDKSLYVKLDETDFDPHKKIAIYKFTNDQSHFTGKGFDPALVAETQKNTVYLMELIEKVAPLHYNGLKALVE